MAPPGTRGAEAVAVIHATIAGRYVAERSVEREKGKGATKGFWGRSIEPTTGSDERVLSVLLLVVVLLMWGGKGDGGCWSCG